MMRRTSLLFANFVTYQFSIVLAWRVTRVLKCLREICPESTALLSLYGRCMGRLQHKRGVRGHYGD